MTRRVIVDENASPGTKLWQQFQQAAGDGEYEYVFLSETHRGILDVEILDKLLKPGVILLTDDCVLHMRALEAGCRSYTLDEQGHLTRSRLPHVQTKKSLPKSVHANLQDDYSQRREHDITLRLTAGFTDRQFKKYRTARRRIRSHFGSTAAVSQVSVTVGSAPTSRGLLCGCVFHVAGNSGVKGLRASEGYCLSQGPARRGAAGPILHALRSQYLLQLDQVRTELFIIPAPSLKLSRQLLESHDIASEPAQEAARELMHGIRQLTLHSCVKGPFNDAMQVKLAQLARTPSGQKTETNVSFFENRVWRRPELAILGRRDVPRRHCTGWQWRNATFGAQRCRRICGEAA